MTKCDIKEIQHSIYGVYMYMIVTDIYGIAKVYPFKNCINHAPINLHVVGLLYIHVYEKAFFLLYITSNLTLLLTVSLMVHPHFMVCPHCAPDTWREEKDFNTSISMHDLGAHFLIVWISFTNVCVYKYPELSFFNLWAFDSSCQAFPIPMKGCL